LSELWKRFWSEFRREGDRDGTALFQQVGRTVNGQPMPTAEFEAAVAHIASTLALGPDDALYEYCCGNGLVTYELAARAGKVVATDFMEHLVDSAREFRHRDNIRYGVADALKPLTGQLGDPPPRKFLMASALAHFDPADLDAILGHVCAAVPAGPLEFLLTGIPDAARKWNFYDTPERRERHLANLAGGNVLNDGIGRWWTPAELIELGHRHNLVARIEPEPAHVCTYRMEVLYSREPVAPPA
jgi:SAM-dependent methyltransferase